MIKKRRKSDNVRVCEECKKSILPGEEYFVFLFGSRHGDKLEVDVHESCDPFDIIPADEEE